MNFASDTVLSKSPKLLDFGMLYVNIKDELGSIFVPITRNGSPPNGSKWHPPDHCISEVTADRVTGAKAKNNYNFKSEFETRRYKVVDQVLGARIVL